MKTYIVYVEGVEYCYVKAGNFLMAEKKAKKKFPKRNVSVVYTEL